MSTVTTLPQSRPLVRADLETMPDDGHRYELLDGVLLVSPAPRRSHQRAVRGLFRVLDQACPEELELLFAPFDVVLADDTVLEPDLLVAPRSQFTERDLPGPPLLAVEVLSASTRRIDLLLKRDRLQSAGVPSYWLVDPDGPSLTALELRDGVYVEAAHVVSDQAWTAERPYGVTVVPAELLR
ncbi:MAG TPA: Uma2 family endonuclease [Mycobacteriales bacterium]|nr:Uma2 family endonuclease [Mycobacteriales bacterium]